MLSILVEAGLMYAVLFIFGSVAFCGWRVARWLWRRLSP